MAKKLFEESNMSAIARKIRAKAGSSKSYKVSEMPSGVDEVYQNGYDIGHASGYGEGRDAGYTEGHEKGYAEGLEEGKAQGGGEGSGDVEEGTEVSMNFGVQCGDKWYCPPNGENATSFYMMKADSSGTYTAFTNFDVTPGTRYKVLFKPINPNNLWENIVFGNNDYSTLTVIANDESLSPYVTKVNADTFIITVPIGCSFIALNGYIQYGCKAYLLD